MGLLRSTTDPAWLAIALGDLPRTMADHAHCEKKAAASALKLVADHPDDPERVRALARLAQEELAHLLAVLAEMGRLGFPALPDGGDPYAQALVARVRPGGAGRERERLLDRLLVGALIEARSHERLALLAGALEEPRLRELYARLARAEAGHERLFLELAASVAGANEAEARLDALAAEEARLLAGLPLAPRIH